jgi:hypothetical protein
MPGASPLPIIAIFASITIENDLLMENSCYRLNFNPRVKMPVWHGESDRR